MAYPHHIRIFTLSGAQYLKGNQSLDEWLYKEEFADYKLHSIYALPNQPDKIRVRTDRMPKVPQPKSLGALGELANAEAKTWMLENLYEEQIVDIVSDFVMDGRVAIDAIEEYIHMRSGSADSDFECDNG